jgi:hypothetical protein
MKNKKQWLSFILIILLLAIGLMASTSFENYDGPIDLPFFEQENSGAEETPAPPYYLLPMVAPAGRQSTG